MVYAYLNTVLLLHSAFMLSMVKMPLKGRLEAIHQIVMEITLLIIENHGKIMELFFLISLGTLPITLLFIQHDKQRVQLMF